MKPARFILCFDQARANGKVACVRQRGKWHLAHRVECHVYTATVYRGANARQPRFYLEGIGRITRQRVDGVVTLVVTP